MITGYTLGGAIGPLISGTALQYFGAWGLSVWLSLLSIAVLLTSLKTGNTNKNG
jgi:cyanate permease